MTIAVWRYDSIWVTNRDNAEMRTMRVISGLLFIALACAGTVRRSEALTLEVPVTCAIGSECFIQNYVDGDPGQGRSDYACGQLTYDSHKGTDFRTRDLAAMKKGVTVVAAAPGRVRAVRDGMPDVSIRVAGAASIAGREAGNAVVIEHGNGWETQYSHLKRGSVMVAAGDEVRAGQALGMIGLSGNTEFPHIDLSVRRNGRIVDPFIGENPPAGCGARGTPLWSEAALAALAYLPTGLLNAGFAPGAPEEGTARNGGYADVRISRETGALGFWVDLFGAQSGDRQLLRIIGPDGRVIHEAQGKIPRHLAALFVASQMPRQPGGWMPGTYRGTYALIRKDKPLLDVSREIHIGE